MVRSWFTTRRLQSQLIAWTAVILLITVPTISEVRIRANIKLLEDNLRVRSQTLAHSAIRVLQLTSASPLNLDIPGLEDRLREFVEADATLNRLDIVRVDRGSAAIVASSSTALEPIVSTVPAAPSSVIRVIDSQRSMVITEPVESTDLAIVAVSSMQNIDRFQDFNRSLIPAFSGVLIAVVISLMYLMYKATVSKRLDELLDGIRQAKEGRIVNIPDDRQDEIGVLAKTFNELLAQVRSFNRELQNEVARATEDLNKRNLALEDTTRQMLAMQHQLLQSERLATVGQMAATFAHEIGSPMTSLSAHAQLLLEDPGLTETQRETLTLIRQQIQAVVQIVKELLRSARRGPGDFVLTDINETLRHVMRLVQPKLMSQRIDVHVELNPLPPVRGYPLYLQEAFLNIVNNASEAMPASGSLEVRSWFDETEQQVHVRIADNGPGIDPMIVERVFDHFVTTKAIGEGAGLGLGIVKEIVDSHRGTFHITPANGHGAAVHLTFPVEDSAVRAS